MELENEIEKKSGTLIDTSTKRRNRRGAKDHFWCAWPAVKYDMETQKNPFAMQEYLETLIHKRADVTDTVAEPPEIADFALWQYEHLRQVTLELNYLLVLLDEHCTPKTCPIMKATPSHQYLCAAHTKAKECNAPDYCVHTLDWAITILTSESYFPSRTSIKSSSIPHLQNVARRLYRLFAHAFFNHKKIFDQFENETHLTERFLALCTKYNLVPKDQQIIPPRQIK